MKFFSARNRRRFDRLYAFIAKASSPYFVESGERHMRLVFCDALGRILKAAYGRPALRTAYVGNQPDVLMETEALADFGFVQPQSGAFFETARDDAMHPYQPLSALNPGAFDVVVVGDVSNETAILSRLDGCPARVIPLRRWANCFTEAVRLSDAKGYRTCLNPIKLALVAAGVALAPPTGALVEAGVYMGGTTLFMFRLQQLLGVRRPIFALDTYEGMPEPTQKDREDAPFVYEAGMFSDNRKDVVRRYWDQAGAADIRMIPGLVQETIGDVQADKIAFMLLDCDQYAGTLGGLQGALPRLASGGMVFVDDSSVAGVHRALQEISQKYPAFRVTPHISHNFDLIYSGDAPRIHR